MFECETKDITAALQFYKIDKCSKSNYKIDKCSKSNKKDRRHSFLFFFLDNIGGTFLHGGKNNI